MIYDLPASTLLQITVQPGEIRIWSAELHPAAQAADTADDPVLELAGSLFGSPLTSSEIDLSSMAIMSEYEIKQVVTDDDHFLQISRRSPIRPRRLPTGSQSSS